jgi:hypothetical protein
MRRTVNIGELNTHQMGVYNQSLGKLFHNICGDKSLLNMFRYDLNM